MPPILKEEDFPKPKQDNYLSYYVYQGEWKPTKPLYPVAASSCSPGPAIVNLPPTIGSLGERKHDPTRQRAPAYKIGIRDERKVRMLGPGPGKYDISKWTNKGLDKCCAPLIGQRTKEIAGFQTPGPAAYYREKGDKSVFPRAPAYSMRVKGAQLKTSQTPAPNEYNMPSMIGPGRTPYSMAPAYSMGLKLEPLHPGGPSPGPAEYMLPSSDINKYKNPAYTMGTKAAMPSAHTLTPGPAAHYAQLVKFDKYSTPRFTFGIKHSPYKAFPGFAAEN